MIIAPLVFATVVSGIAGMGDAKAVGRIGGKALAWFITASLVSLLLGMVFANLLQPGSGLTLPLPDKDAATNLKTGGMNLQRVRHPRVPGELLRGDGDQRDPADPGLLVLLRLRLASLKREPAVTIVTASSTSSSA